MLRNERQLRESPDAIESALPSPQSRGCIYGSVSATEAIQTPVANAEVQIFHANKLVLSARSDAQGSFHTCVDPDAPDEPWQQQDEVKLRIETLHPDFVALSLRRTWTIRKPLKLRILLRPTTVTPPQRN